MAPERAVDDRSPEMNLPRTVAEILRDHVTLEVEGIDRMYLNAVVPILQTERGISWFFREVRGHSFASSALMAPMTRDFVDAFEAFAKSQKLDVVTFEKKQRKEDVAAEYRARFRGKEGFLFVGKAQEKASVFRTERRKNPTTGASYAWLYRSTAMVNQYYLYALDRDFGPFFLKFCSYFPFNAKLCINGHERQLEHRDISTRRSTMGSSPATTRPRCRRSATNFRRRASTPCFESGSAERRIPSRPRTGPGTFGTTSRSSRPSSR